MVLNVGQNKNIMFAADQGAQPDSPGSAWVWNRSQGQWVQPPMPSDETMNYSWDDSKGWVGTKKVVPSSASSDNGKVWKATDGTEFTDQNAYATYQASLISSKGVTDAAAATAAATAAAAASAAASSAAAIAASQAAAQAAAQGQKVNAIAFLTSSFTDMGLGADIANAVTNLVQQGYTADTIQMIAQDPKSKDPLAIAFQQRFPANAARMEAGLPVLSPAEYLATERSYAQILQSYGLPASFAQNKDIFTKLLTNDISPTELNARVTTAKQVINDTDPLVSQQLQYYYGLSKGDMIAHVLDPAIATPIIQQQISTSQVGAEAARYGANINQTYAQQLSGLGVTQAQANQGFQNIAQSQTAMQELATRYDAYGPAGQVGSQLQAATFGTTGAVAAQEELNRLKMQEVSQFSGSSGAGKGSLMGTEAGLS